MPSNDPQQQPSTPQSAARAGERASDVSAKLSERIEQGAQQTLSTTVQRARSARERAESGIEAQRAQVTKRIRRVSGALRAGGTALSTEDAYVQRLLEQASDQIQRIADYIDHAEPNALLDDVQTFARRRPGVFFGGALMLGLALGRFAKSTTSDLDADELEESLASSTTASGTIPSGMTPSGVIPSGYAREVPAEEGRAGSAAGDEEARERRPEQGAKS